MSRSNEDGISNSGALRNGSDFKIPPRLYRDIFKKNFADFVFSLG